MKSEKRMKIMKEKLMKGQKSAIELHDRLFLHIGNDESESSTEKLSEEVLRSFTESLALTTKSVDCGGDGSTTKPGVKDRRGSYKRKKSSDSWVKVSSNFQDGFAWRKYGQKEIFEYKHPRCYYRCTHKLSQGCTAMKQVQKIKQDPLMYQITYFNHHTCAETLVLPHLIVESYPNEDSNLLSFKAVDHNAISLKQEEINSQDPAVTNISSSFGESKKNIQKIEFHSANLSSNPNISSCQGNRFGCEDKWSPSMVNVEQEEEANSGLYSCLSTNFSDLDMEVNQFGDINLDDFLYG